MRAWLKGLFEEKPKPRPICASCGSKNEAWMRFPHLQGAPCVCEACIYLALTRGNSVAWAKKQ